VCVPRSVEILMDVISTCLEPLPWRAHQILQVLTRLCDVSFCRTTDDLSITSLGMYWNPNLVVTLVMNDLKNRMNDWQLLDYTPVRTLPHATAM